MIQLPYYSMLIIRNPKNTKLLAPISSHFIPLIATLYMKIVKEASSNP